MGSSSQSCLVATGKALFFILLCCCICINVWMDVCMCMCIYVCMDRWMDVCNVHVCVYAYLPVRGGVKHPYSASRSYDDNDKDVSDYFRSHLIK